MKVKSLSRVQLFATPWIVGYHTPPSMVFSRHKYCNGLLFSPLGDLPNPGIEPRPPALQADALPSEPPAKPCVDHSTLWKILKDKGVWTSLPEREIRLVTGCGRQDSLSGTHSALKLLSSVLCGSHSV